MRAALAAPDGAGGRRTAGRGARRDGRARRRARAAFHAEVGELLRELGVEQVIGVGDLARAYGGDWVATADEAAARLREVLAAGRHGAREGLAVGGTRGRRGEPVRVMARVLAAALIAMIISILAGPWFISFLRRNEFGQQVREEGPQHHATKQGTPTMGGLLIIAAASIAFLAVERPHGSGAHHLRHGAGLRRDRLPRRLHQAAPPPLARALRPLEDAPAARRSRSPSASPRTIRSSATRSSSRSSTGRCRSGPAGTSCCS